MAVLIPSTERIIEELRREIRGHESPAQQEHAIASVLRDIVNRSNMSDSVIRRGIVRFALEMIGCLPDVFDSENGELAKEAYQKELFELISEVQKFFPSLRAIEGCDGVRAFAGELVRRACLGFRLNMKGEK